MKSRTACFKEGGKRRETGFFEVAVDGAVGIQADLKVFGLGVFDLAGLELGCADPGLRALNICFQLDERGSLPRR